MGATGTAQAADPARKVVRIFQSYGWRDATEIAQRLKASLVGAGYEVWLDREQLREDDKHFSIALEAAVKDCEVVVALLSPHSVRGQADQDERSSICYNEIRLADELLRPIVPVRVQKFRGPPPFLIIKYRRIDWLEWNQPDTYRKGLDEIVAAIEQVITKDKNFDPDIAFQTTNFTRQLRTARDDFVGRHWLFSRLDTWLAEGRSCFVIEGDTGSGKTAVIAELVRRNPGGRILGYHFCGSVPVTLDAAAFVRSIAGMLANSVDAYAELLWNGKLAGWLMAADPETMFLQGVLEPLQGIKMEGRFYLVVDALDEAMGGTSAQISIPQLLASMLEEFPEWLKLLVTTRPQARIQRLFRSAEVCVLDRTIEDHRMDVRAYVEKRLSQSSLPATFIASARTRAVQLIDDQASGNFQYASSVLDALGRGEMKLEQLDHLPARLEDFYFARAQRKFPTPPDYRLARIVLGLLLVSREPLTPPRLVTLSRLDRDSELQPTLDALSGFVGPEFVPGGDETYRIAHKSITDWLLSNDAGVFQVDPRGSSEAVLNYCLDWRANRDPYAMRHLIAHLLEAGPPTDALQAVQDSLFAERLAMCNEPRLDLEDSSNLTLALVAARDRAGILTLARTENIWQRDGVAAALQSTKAEDLVFVDEIVGALLELKQ